MQIVNPTAGCCRVFGVLLAALLDVALDEVFGVRLEDVVDLSEDVVDILVDAFGLLGALRRLLGLLVVLARLAGTLAFLGHVNPSLPALATVWLY